MEVHLIVPANEWQEPESVEGVTIHPLRRKPGRIRRATITAFQAFQTARRIRPDICHFHDPELMWVGLLLRMLGYRVVQDIHEDFVGDVMEKPWIPKSFRRTVGWVVTTLESMMARTLSAIVTAGDDIRQRLMPHAQQCISVQNYPDLDSFPRLEDQQQSQPPRIVFLGGMNTTVVPQSLISAIELVPNDLEFEFVWGGKRCEPAVLSELKKRSGWARVKFLDFVPFAEVNQLLRGARAAVVLYADAPNNYSIRSNRLFETMAVSLPIVGPSYGDWSQFFADYPCGIAVNPNQPQEIATAFERLLRDAESAQVMGEVGRKAVEQRFNWATEIERLVALYESLMA
jgi:glycosyltransferase involved in cell wall biosynthesis